jgi:SAM-dependent methyltransferase
MSAPQLSHEEILTAYDAVAPLYPHVPSMCLWRAWEIAAYRRYRMIEPVLDVGCGDGQFFRLLFPDIGHVTGVDFDAAAIEVARRVGVYERLHVAPADQMPVEPQSFGSAFANCSLEHMDNLPGVLAGVLRALKPGGHFLFSVVTDKFISWNPLPPLAGAIAGAGARERLFTEHLAFHHLVNPLTADQWMRHLHKAGFEKIEHVPIMPEICSRLFLFLDALWHVKNPAGADSPNPAGGEIGGVLEPYLARVRDFPQSFREVFSGLLKMEMNPEVGSGAVFLARAPESSRRPL